MLQKVSTVHFSKKFNLIELGERCHFDKGKRGFVAKTFLPLPAKKKTKIPMQKEHLEKLEVARIVLN